MIYNVLVECQTLLILLLKQPQSERILVNCPVSMKVVPICTFFILKIIIITVVFALLNFHTCGFVLVGQKK